MSQQVSRCRDSPGPSVGAVSGRPGLQEPQIPFPAQLPAAPQSRPLCWDLFASTWNKRISSMFIS